MTIHCYMSEKFNFQRIHIQLCKHPSILPVNFLLGSSQVLKHLIFYAPPHTHTTSNATMRFAEEHYKFFVIASLSCLAVVSSVYSCHNKLFLSCIKVCVCVFVWHVYLKRKNSLFFFISGIDIKQK